MFVRKLTLFRLMGFAIKVDASWVFLAVLVTWSLASGMFPYYYKDLPTQTYWMMGLTGAAGLFASIVLHELGHAIVARRCGLNIREITLFLFGGVAEMDDEPPSAQCELIMALAGPLTSMCLAVAFLLAQYALKNAGAAVPLTGVMGYLGWLNGLLAAFNLIPAFPLDGGRVLRSVLWGWKGNLRWATRIASEVGRGFGFLLIILGVMGFLGGNVVGGFWWVLIGLFMRNASHGSYRQLLVRRVLEGERVSRFMKTDPITVPPYISVQELVENYVYKFHFKMYPVTKDGKVVGCVSTREVRELPQDEWTRSTVSDIMQTCSRENSVPPDEDAMKALSQMSRIGSSRLLVLEEDRLVGIVSLKDLLRFLALRLELEENASK